MTQIMMQKRLGAFHPVDDKGREALKSLADRETVRVEFKKARNAKFHRKFFAMLQIVLQNQEHYSSIDDLLDVCKLRVGHVRVISTKRGEERIPKSISFASMDSTQFNAFYDRAVTWVITEVIPGLNKTDLGRAVEEELLEFAG